MKKSYYIICGKYRKFKNLKISQIFEKTLVLSVIYSKLFTIDIKKMFSFLSHNFLEKNLKMYNQGKFNSTRHSIFCYYMQMRCKKVRLNVVLIYAVNFFAA